MVGDSIVRWVGQNNDQLLGGGTVIWKGVSGARWAGVTNRLRRYLTRHEYPHTLILHLGSNDIFRSDLGDIRARVASNIMAIRQMLPETRIIWPDILQRVAYRNERGRGAGHRSTRNINSYARRILSGMENCHVIRHAGSINATHQHLYHNDGIHLSDQGKVRFRSNLSEVLLFFNNKPFQFHHPLRN